MRVLLTGAAGFMGAHVLQHILETTDWEVVCIDSFRHMGKTSRLRQVMDKSGDDRVTVLRHDLTCPIDDQLALRIGQIDYVLSIASESHVDRSIDKPRPFIENNVLLMLTLLEYIREHPVQKFIHISTDEVYGPAYDHDHKEGESHKPSNPYSASKAAQEDICYAYWRTYGLPIVITNTMNIIGEMQDPEKYVPMTIQKVVNGDMVTIHASHDLKTVGSRYYLHARNQADALLFILKNVTPVFYGQGELEQFNIVGEREVDNLELANLLATFIGKPLKYELVDFHSSRPGHDLRYGLNGEKLKQLGWKAPLSLEDSLKRTVDWTLAHKEWLL